MQLKFKHFIYLNILDIILTFYALSFMALNEANPMMRYAINYFGIVIALILIKLIGIIIIYIYYKILSQKLRTASLCIFCGFYIIIVINNMFQIVYYKY